MKSEDLQQEDGTTCPNQGVQTKINGNNIASTKHVLKIALKKLIKTGDMKREFKGFMRFTETTLMESILLAMFVAIPQNIPNQCFGRMPKVLFVAKRFSLY